MGEKSLFRPMRIEDEINVIAAAFGKRPVLDALPGFSDFINYYKTELGRVNHAVELRSAEKHSFVVQNHAELASVITILSEAGASAESLRSAIRRKIQDKMKGLPNRREPSQENLNRCIDLAIRILTMVNVREQYFALQTPKTPWFEWDDQSSFPQFTKRLFKDSRKRKRLIDNGRWLQSSFTVATMDSICGLNVEWTQSLEDHLRLDRGTKTLRVFSNRSFLIRRLECDRANVRLGNVSFRFPESLLEETLRTFDLLFPFGDSKTNKYLKKRDMQQQLHGEGLFDNRRTLDLADFHYWRERLFELHWEVFQLPPQSWYQLLVDRRNPQQWLTLWIAFVVFLLTLISTTASIVQAWAAVEALKS